MLFLLLGGCEKSSVSTSMPLSAQMVKTQKVIQSFYPQSDLIPGTVQSKTRGIIEAKISARILRLNVSVGQIVKEGDILVQLDEREIRSRYDQMVTARDLASSDLKRYASLIKDEVVTQQEYESVESRYRIAEAQVTEAQTLLSYTQIAAPFDGVITQKLVDIGDLASPGRALLEMEDPLKLRFQADVPDGLLSKIALGDKLQIQIASLDHFVEGVVSEIAPISDSSSRTFPVKLDLESTSALRSGQFGRVSIPIKNVECILIPDRAVVRRGQLELVFVVKAEKAHLRLIKTGKRIGNEVEVLSGLEVGDEIVTEGSHSLSDATPVKVN